MRDGGMEIKMIFKGVMMVVIVLGILLLCVGVIDGNRFRVVEETIKLDKINRDFRFVLLSDLHNKVYGKKNEKVIKEIEKANPDFVVIAGDLITSHVHEETTAATELLQALEKICPVYYGMGNHETKIRVEKADFGEKFDIYMEEVAKTKTKVLENESIVLPQYHLKITGLELERYYFSKFRKRELSRKKLEEYVGKADETYCNLLIAHHPDYFEEYAAWGADLVLAGHVHGGIMRLPWLGGVIAPSYELFPKYDGGIFQSGKATMLLGRGMGAHTIPLRFFNPAELYVVNCLHK